MNLWKLMMSIGIMRGKYIVHYGVKIWVWIRTATASRVIFREMFGREYMWEVSKGTGIVLSVRKTV